MEGTTLFTGRVNYKPTVTGHIGRSSNDEKMNCRCKIDIDVYE